MSWLGLLQVLVWWFNTRVALLTGTAGHGGKHNMSSNSHSSQYACSSLCDEVRHSACCMVYLLDACGQLVAAK